MRFFRQIIIGGLAYVGALLFSVGVFAGNHIMKIAFVGNAELRKDIIRKTFDKVESGIEGDQSSEVYGIRAVTSDDTVLYKFRNPLIGDSLEKIILSDCNITFMVADFSTEENSVNNTLTKDLSAVRRASGGSKVLLVIINANSLKEIDLNKLNAARSLHGEDNFDYILTLPNDDEITFRNNFFEAVDRMINWRTLPHPVGNDLNIVRKLDPAGAIVSKYFDDMVGMKEFKNELKGIIARIMQNKRDMERGKSNHTKPSYHMALMGNPGTGKTTIARKMGSVLYDANIISENKFIQVERKDLVSDHIGGTEKKISEILKSADGGVLFIDEAYSLTGEGNDFGKHVIEGILTSMTDNKCVVIVAGYPNKMHKFLNSNEGLYRRFAHHIVIPDYNEQDLFSIFKNLVSKNGFEIQYTQKERIESLVIRYFQGQKAKLKEKFGNAGSVENFFESVMNQRAMRLSRRPGVSEDFITLEDVTNATK